MSRVLVLKSSILGEYSQSGKLVDFLLNNGVKLTLKTGSPCAIWPTRRCRSWMVK